MAGAVESAIRATLKPGHALETLGRNATASVGSFDADSVTLLMGYKRVKTPVTWACLEAIPMFLVGRDWVQLTGPFDPAASSGTLASFLESKHCKATAALVGALLEAAGVVEVDRDGRVAVRLVRAMSPARSSKPQTSDEGGIIAGTRKMVESRHRPHPDLGH
jgi:hypothetical protein